jgi:mannitol-1-phosphate/altronate dehydrogenase
MDFDREYLIKIILTVKIIRYTEAQLNRFTNSELRKLLSHIIALDLKKYRKYKWMKPFL